MLFKFFSAALITSLLSLQVMADSSYEFEGRKYKISYSEDDQRQLIKLDGQIYSGFVEDLTGLKEVQKRIQSGKNIVITLQSGGGFQMKFNSLAKSIKNACRVKDKQNKKKINKICHITTEVISGTSCRSACVNLFMIGDTRRAGRTARFGFHQATITPNGIPLKSFAERELKKNGVDPNWIKDNKDIFQTSEMTLLLPEELQHSNIITEYMP